MGNACGCGPTPPSIPPGTIILWGKSKIPPGWALCDGNNGTPDLTGRVVTGHSGLSEDVNSIIEFYEKVLVSEETTQESILKNRQKIWSLINKRRSPEIINFPNVDLDPKEIANIKNFSARKKP